MRAWDLATSLQWAITDNALRTMLEIAAREGLSPEVVEAEIGRPLQNTQRTTVRDGIATIPVVGPLFRRANLFTRASGATSIEQLALDFQTAVSDPQVQAILLNVDSPGGEVNGVSEFAQMVFSARGVKPVLAYVGGSGASGAYWIASAADEVVISDTALLGSVGAVVTVERKGEQDARRIEIVSSQSPRKRVDAETKEGRAELQALVDSLADVFIDSVARYRGRDRDTVLADYGQGGLLVGEQAVEAGLADRVATYEAVHAELATRSAPGWGAPAAGGTTRTPQTQEAPVSKQDSATPAAENRPAITVESVAADHPDIAEHFRAEGAAAERGRILAIQALPSVGHENVVAQCVEDAGCTVEMAALRVLQAAQQAERSEDARRQAALEARKRDEEELDAPLANPDAETEAGSDEAIAARILGIHNPKRAAK